jgi:hypothetical protein
MTIYHWILLAAFSVFLLYFIFSLILTFVKKGPADPSEKNGNVNKAIIYSFTGAMSPSKKESAFLHLPTYAAGMVFHLGTFFSFFWLMLLFFNFNTGAWFHLVSSSILAATGICGISILIKRIIKTTLRQMSNPDDYFSNLLVTGFQLLMAIEIFWDKALPTLFIYAAFLFLYIPFGKLKHTVYFFSSRIYLGKFFGKRGVWPVK